MLISICKSFGYQVIKDPSGVELIVYNGHHFSPYGDCLNEKVESSVGLKLAAQILAKVIMVFNKRVRSINYINAFSIRYNQG